MTIKSLIVWLMLLTLPLQGFASVTKLLCCAPETVAAQVSVHTSSPHASMLSKAGKSDISVVHQHNDDEATPHHHHHPDGKCGACASCCSGAAMTPSFIAALPDHPSRYVATASSAVPLASVDLDLPERPPRA